MLNLSPALLIRYAFLSSVVLTTVATAACSKKQIIESLYTTGQQAYCELNDIGGDYAIRRERCEHHALGGNRETYRQFKDERDEELRSEDARAAKPSPDQSITEIQL